MAKTLIVYMVLALVLLLVITALEPAQAEPVPVKFVVYGDPRCPHCKALTAAIEEAFPGSLVFINIGSNMTGLQEYKKLWDIVVEDIRYAIPFTVLYLNNTPRAFIVGEMSVDELRNLVQQLVSTSLILYCRGSDCSELGQEKYSRVLEALGLQSPTPMAPSKVAEEAADTSTQPGNLAGILAVLAGLALMDSVNPCFLAFYALLVASASALGGARRAIVLGLAIAAGVYVGYFLLGFGIASLLEATGVWLRQLLGVAAAVLGLNILLRRIGGGTLQGSVECKICKWADRVRDASPVLAFSIGFVASWTLLPCTAGPYVAAIALLDGYPFIDKLGLLAFYNMVFISPLLAVLLGSAKAVEKLSYASKIVEPLAGALLLALGVAIAVGII